MPRRDKINKMLCQEALQAETKILMLVWHQYLTTFRVDFCFDARASECRSIWRKNFCFIFFRDKQEPTINRFEQMQVCNGASQLFSINQFLSARFLYIWIYDCSCIWFIQKNASESYVACYVTGFSGWQIYLIAS